MVWFFTPTIAQIQFSSHASVFPTPLIFFFYLLNPVKAGSGVKEKEK
ncbi:Hypothetical protein ABZS17D1_03496 [Kosakonia cowanii]